MSSSLILWIIIGIVCLVADILTSAFLFVWFTVGAIFALIAYTLKYSIVVQFSVFVIVSVILVAVCYPLIKKNIKKNIKPTALRESTYKGKKIIIDREMQDNNAVKLDGVLWNIKNDDIVLKEGDKIEITGIDGNRVLVKKCDY
ncbi:membrane protein implicated in regulation of membrane protease activity [Clostridium algifaecis]|uniref:Membrane protein implicated in regulation of membrane protease activity n=1 Tax=Clostridium algifaecis TaxID=1472040 RepID=A0ABS4KQC4_9CLOT|nr:NfeD family protein [Clostridium algifaecis]MBP2032252.1 membrane protein implicated in regulation of membrane protease activity [Clostridium algifaecis]